jgi:hypothetical protein
MGLIIYFKINGIFIFQKLEQKEKQVAQFTANLANLRKQLAIMSGNSTKVSALSNKH